MEKTSNCTEASGKFLASYCRSALWPDQGENGADNTDAQDNADESIAKPINARWWSVILQHSQIKGQRNLQSHVRDPFTTGSNPCGQAVEAEYDQEVHSQ